MSLSEREHTEKRGKKKKKDVDSDEGKQFIGGIAWDTSEKTLTEYFNQ